MDNISTLPDEILCHILSYLPSKDAIQTCVLSSRWKNLMTFVPVLSVESPPSLAETFINTLNKLLNSSNLANLQKLKLQINNHRWDIIRFHLNDWINSAIKRNVVDLDVRVPYFLINAAENRDLALCITSSDSDLALCITSSDSLQNLKYSGGLRFFMPCTTESFKNLKKFKVELNDPDKELLAKLFCSLPQLGRLSLKINISQLMENDMNISINIIIPALKQLSLCIRQAAKDNVDFKILIDVPLLEYISIEEDFLATYLVKSPPGVVEATLDVCEKHLYLHPEHDFDLFYRVIGLLEGLSSAKSLSVLTGTSIAADWAESELPLLHGLTYLELDDAWLSGLLLIPMFLQSAPNLKKVLLTILEEDEGNNVGFHWVSPETFPTSLLNLEEFEIVGTEKIQEVPYWKEMAAYIIENATVLKKFVIDGQDWCSIA